MKRSTSKIVSLLIALALLACAAVGITAFAEEATAAPEIISYNVAHGNEFKLMFAVKADTVSGDALTLTVKDEANETLDTVTLAGEALEATRFTLGETECYELTTNKGIAAKDIADQYYITVADGDAESTVRYSLLEYCYQRLYKDGIINAAEGTADGARKQLYLDTVAYGASAQSVLINWADGNADLNETPVSDYYYVAVNGGTVDGTYSAGIYTGETAVTLNYTGTDAISLWRGYKADGSYVNYDLGETVTVSETTVFVPIERIPGMGAYADKADGDFNTGLWSGKGEVKTEEGNSFINVTSGSYGNLFFERTDANDDGFGDSYVVEFDFRIHDAGLRNDAMIYATLNLESSGGSTVQAVGGDGRLTFGHREATDTADWSGYFIERTNGKNPTKIEVDTWNTMRLEFGIAANRSYVHFYLNDEYLHSYTTTITADAGYKLDNYCVYFRDANANVDFDNVYVGTVEGNLGTGVFADKANGFEGGYTKNGNAIYVDGAENDFISLRGNSQLEKFYLPEGADKNADLIVVEYDMRYDIANGFANTGHTILNTPYHYNTETSKYVSFVGSTTGRNYHSVDVASGTISYGTGTVRYGEWVNVRHEYRFSLREDGKYTLSCTTFFNGVQVAVNGVTVTAEARAYGWEYWTIHTISSSQTPHFDIDNFYMNSMTEQELAAAIAAKAAE